MRSIFQRVRQSAQSMRPGSVLILVVALLVLMALIGTAFLSTSRVDRYATVQNTNNTEIDLLVEGVKNMAKAVIVGSQYDNSAVTAALPSANTFKPANNSTFHNWTAPDMYHQFSDDPNVATMSLDTWLSPRTPSVTFQGSYAVGSVPSYTAPAQVIPVWPSIGRPLVGNVFESPFVQTLAGVNIGTQSFTFNDRMTADFAPPSSFNGLIAYGKNIASTGAPMTGSQFTPTFASITYPDGTTATFPAFQINTYNTSVTPPTVTGSYKYLAGDADNDGIADCALFKLPLGQLDGLTYYAGVRIVDNSAAVNVTTALSRRFDFNGLTDNANYTNSATRVYAAGVNTYNGVFNLGCFGTNVGLLEMLHTYDGTGTFLYNKNGGSLGTEFATWNAMRLGQGSASIAMRTVSAGIVTALPITAVNTHLTPYSDANVARTDFAYTTLGDLFQSQLGRRPEVPGNCGTMSSNMYQCVGGSPGDAAALAYHFCLRNPYASPSPVETALIDSIYKSAPNGTNATIINRAAFVPPNPGGVGTMSSAYSGTPATAITVASQWYAENFDWDATVMAGMGTLSGGYVPPVAESVTTVGGSTSATAAATDLPHRVLLTSLSTTSNVVPRPQAPLPAGTSMSTNAPYTPTMCKTPINTASKDQLWRAFWLAMTSDDGSAAISPLGDDVSTTFSGHALVTGQSLFTGSQFNQMKIADVTGTPDTQKDSDFSAETTTPFRQHPQRMFRSSLRIPADTTASNVYYPNGMYLPAKEMVKVRSAIAAVNTIAMRDAAAGFVGYTEKIPFLDVPVTITNLSAANVRVFGTTQQPYITEVYANTNITMSQSLGATNGMTNGAPYVAVELYNPYPTPMSLNGWQLIAVDRTPGSNEHRSVSAAASCLIHQFVAGEVIPAAAKLTSGTNPQLQGGYLLLENLGSGGVIYRPAGTNLPPMAALASRNASLSATPPLLPLNVITAVPLQTAIGKELVLVRPVAASATAAEAAGIDEVPLDSFDFTGLQPSSPTIGADSWHYVRANAFDNSRTPANQQSDGLWRFIYPGRYDASDPKPYAEDSVYSVPPPSITTPGVAQNPGYAKYSRRQQGTEAGHFQPYPYTGAGVPPPPSAGRDPFDGGGATNFVAVTLGKDSSNTDMPNDNSSGASYPVTFPFQYLNNGQPGPNPLVASPNVNAFPFGAFARNSDILQVPFVGGYVVTTTVPPANTAWSTADMNAVVEMNGITMDCSFAEDTDVNDDPPSQALSQSSSGVSDVTTVGPWEPCESVGHFAPINMHAVPPGGVPVNGIRIADGDPTLAYLDFTSPKTDRYAAYKNEDVSGGASTLWRYRWAGRLFDYVTAQSPSDDYLPNANPTNYTQTAPTAVVNSYATSTAGNLTNGTTADDHTEDAVPTYGQINLNTASWRVLAALRFCPYDDADPLASQFTINETTGVVTVLPVASRGLAANVPDNVQLAKAIASWRDRYGSSAEAKTFDPTHSANPSSAFEFALSKGPFHTLADLFQVPAVRNYVQALAFSTTSNAEPDINFGHLSPAFAGTLPAPTDGVRNDVEERYDLLDRIGTQATVRSDTFTVYIVIQGWRNAQSINPSSLPQLVTQRHAAFVIDRSSINPTNTDPRVYNIPQD